MLYKFPSGKKTVVKFGSKGTIVENGPYKGRARVQTFCNIKDITDPVITINVSSGWAKQNPIDINVKFLGRKLALTRAMEGAKDYLSKEERQVIWADFLKLGLVVSI